MKPIDNTFIQSRLGWPAVGNHVPAVSDTDVFNEIDDQFALVYALPAKDRLDLQALYAAPFHNDRSTGPADGMAKSYDEIVRILEILGRRSADLVLGGPSKWIGSRRASASVTSDARDDLIDLARARPDHQPQFVIAIGAPTDIASAILAAPDIREKVVVLWLAGQPLHWPFASEFNHRQDTYASQVILDSSVPLVLFPCMQAAEPLTTTVAELNTRMDGMSRVGSYLAKIFREYKRADPPPTAPGSFKTIWDLAPLAWLMVESWVDTTVVASPSLTSGPPPDHACSTGSA
ncbi:MAG: nucleoside hydrolase [Planctomycetota bacterium]